MHSFCVVLSACFLVPALRAAGEDAPLAQKPAEQAASATTPPEAKAEVQTTASAAVQTIDLDYDGAIDVFVTNVLQPAAGPTAPQALSNYWIGIDGTPIDDALRAQLEVSAAQGLLINQVVEDGPAAQAGLKQYDVLISSLDTPIAQIADLAKILDEKKESVLPLKLVRAGKRIIIEVMPQRRPASQTGDTCPAISKVADEEFVRRAWLDVSGNSPSDDEVEQFVSDKREKKRELLVNRLLRKSTHANRSCIACHANDGDAQKIYYQAFLDRGLGHFEDLGAGSGWQNVHFLPGIVQNWQSAVTVNGQQLPDDVTVSITRKGNEPARITVRKGDRIWESSESEGTDKIPEEARTYLTPFCTSLQNLLMNQPPPLSGTISLNENSLRPLVGKIYWQADTTLSAQPAADANTQPAATESAFQRLDKQLESLGAQLGDLRQAMQQLRETLQADKAKPPVPEKKP
jgi:hypothetical protein